MSQWLNAFLHEMDVVSLGRGELGELALSQRKSARSRHQVTANVPECSDVTERLVLEVVECRSVPPTS